MAADDQIPSPWIISQRANHGRSITLSGSAAPHGRPRRGAIATTKTTVRAYSRRYPGGNQVTRHIFGTAQAPITLHGRLMDHQLGARGAALSRVRELEKLCEETKNVNVNWGDTLSFEGFVTSLEIGYESPSEYTWILEIEVDDRLDVPVSKFESTQSPVSYTEQIWGYFDTLAVPKDMSLRASFLDPLSLAVSLILDPLIKLQEVADRMASFKESTLSEIRRFRAGLGILRNALSSLRDTFESAPSEFALEAQSAKDELKLSVWQANMSVAILDAFAAIGEADQAAQRAQQGRIKAIIIANDGDTWESLSVQVYGNAGKATAIREVNDAGTAQPQPGEAYIAPN